MIADWIAKIVGESMDDDHLLVLRLWVALGTLGPGWDRSEFLSPTPSPRFIDDLRAAIPDATPPEESGPMPAAEYRCWQASDVVAFCQGPLADIWHTIRVKMFGTDVGRDACSLTARRKMSGAATVASQSPMIGSRRATFSIRPSA